MGRTVLFVENFYSQPQFPGGIHLVDADEEPAGHEARRVATGRRSPINNYATATTANDAWWVRVQCNRIRAANMVALDRGHNLAGKAVQLQGSDDGVNWTTVVDVSALPDVAGPGTLDAPLVPTLGVWGVRTEEGAWLCRFPDKAFSAWRLNVSAMGASLKPQIVGLYLGQALEVDLNRPVAYNRHELVGETRESDLGWQAMGRQVPRRSGVLHLRPPNAFTYPQVRYNIEGHYGRRRPMWIVPDTEQPEFSFLAVLPDPRVIGFERGASWLFEAGDIPYVEHEPLEEVAA